MKLNWYCHECQREFMAEEGPTAICPGCGSQLYAGPPFGTWDGFTFVPAGRLNLEQLRQEAEKDGKP